MNNNFHDSNIVRYQVNCAERQITMELTDYQLANRVVKFEDVVGHHFEQVLEKNIVFEFEEYSAYEFFQRFEKQIQLYWQHGLRLEKNNVDAFCADAASKELKFIIIHSSYGLTGWVICKSIAVS